MAGALARAEEIVTELVAAGVRASLDPSAVSPPAVLVVPPGRRYDLPCGWSASWTAVALVPGAQGADRTTFAAIEALTDAVAGVLDLERTEIVAYTLNGTSYPAALCQWTEAVS